MNDVAFLENDHADNRTVTRGHAVIRFDAQRGEHRLFDEGSANGTWVNGVRIQEQPLYPGDSIRIGQTQFQFEV